MGRCALVAGATGAAGKRLVEELRNAGWKVTGLCRKAREPDDRVRYASVDLLDGDAVDRALSAARDATHVFYTARAPHGEGGVESVEDNVAMLRHVIEAAERHCPALEHVHLVEGGKWYGQHLGSYPTPAREDDPRHLPPNFYYDQEDLLRQRQHGKAWSWSACRPNVICDFAPERPRNIVSIVGAYAAICRELGIPLDYPGHPLQFRAVTEVTDATHLAHAMIHIATAPACRNEAYNVTNGDVFRWERLWPSIAAFFGMRSGTVRPLLLADWMRDKEPVWQRIVARYDLKPRRLEQVAMWSFADVLFRQTFDVISSTTKLRRSGFHRVVDTEEMFIGHLSRYRAARILP